MDKFWKFKNQTTTSAELLLYGPISSQSWWGDEITPKQFAQDLKDLGPIMTLNVRIDSGGGDVFAGVAIHNMIKRSCNNVNVFIDGLAASAASMIAMAGTTITMMSGTMMMIHNPLSTLMGMYCSAELRSIADVLDKVKESVSTIYEQKSGKTTEEMSKIMDDETWLTPQDALEMGFCDCVDASVVATMSLDRNCLISNGVSFDLSKFKHIPKIKNAVLTPAPIKNEEEIILDINELKTKYPDLYNAAMQEGVTAERARMKAIDSLSLPGHDAIVNKARYETGATAERVAMEIIVAEKSIRENVVKNLAADAAASGANGVAATPPPNKAVEEAEIKAVADKIAAGANERRK
jgi:ATP-dependent protease ClpP protease subunit